MAMTSSHHNIWEIYDTYEKEMCRGNIAVERKLGHLIDYPRVNHIMAVAAASGNKRVINLMIKKGAKDWNLALVNAISQNQTDIMEDMLKRGADDFNAGLAAAARAGNRDNVGLMIKHGADDFDRMLISAARGGHLSIMDDAIEHGAASFTFAVEAAYMGKHNRVVAWLYENYGTKIMDVFAIVLLGTAARTGQNELIKFAFSKLPESEKVWGWNSVFLNAAKGGHRHIMEWLLATERVSWNKRITDHILIYAAQGEQREIMELAAKNGADNWSVALHAMYATENTGFFTWLLSRVVPSEIDWNIILRNSISSGNYEIMELAIKNGADDWNLAFAYAASSGYLNIMTYILKKGVTDISHAIHFSKNSGHLDVTEWLKYYIDTQLKYYAKLEAAYN